MKSKFLVIFSDAALRPNKMKSIDKERERVYTYFTIINIFGGLYEKK
jgi:hypothetical protein